MSSPFILIINNTESGEVRHMEGNTLRHACFLIRKEFESLKEFLSNNPPEKNAKLKHYDLNEYVLKAFDSEKKRWVDKKNIVHGIFDGMVKQAYYRQNLNIIENYF